MAKTREVTCSNCDTAQQITVPADHLGERLPELAGRADAPVDPNELVAWLADWAQIRWECSSCSAYNTYSPPELERWAGSKKAGEHAQAMARDAQAAALRRQLAELEGGPDRSLTAADAAVSSEARGTSSAS